MFVIMALIVLGGLGYVVLIEIWKRFRRGEAGSAHRNMLRLSLHARVVLRMSAILIVGGTACLMLFGMTSAEASWSDLTIHALFQSVSSRTAGFNSCDIGKLPNASLFALTLLMFIGGSPASCAGGIKTTTLAIWLARVRAGLVGRSEVRLLDRSLNPDLVNRTDLLIALAIFWNTAGILFLLTSQSAVPAQAIELIFEHVSAFGTVGLSTGITPQLTISGKLWIIATMYVGRLGPLTVAMWMVPKGDAHVHYPKATVMIG
jgi:trk system potassium uptake protein TrkH